MAEQEEKQPEKETQAKNPQEKKTTKELVSEASKAFSERMQEAHASGNAVWQKPYEERQNIHAPVLIYQGRDGEHKSFYPPVANMLPAVQHQLDIGSQDNRWIPAKEAGANPDITPSVRMRKPLPLCSLPKTSSRIRRSSSIWPTCQGKVFPRSRRHRNCGGMPICTI